MVKWIRKRTNEVVKFHPEKITNAIAKAMHAVSQYNKKAAQQLTKDIIKTIDSKLNNFEQKIPNVEQVQDTVEEILMASRYDRVAKAYILYRKSRTHARELKKFFNIRDDLKLGVNAIKVLEERYLLKNKKGEIIETPTEMFKRVAKTIASVDKKYGENPDKSEKEFIELMKNLEFLPNSPTLMNAGTELGQLAACFVLPIEDNLESIFTTLDNMALIQQSGGGTGFNFSKLRPSGDIVQSTKGVASGPVSFMRIYDSATDVIKQGGKRRGANMGILHCSHPDIEEFITAKQGAKKLSNFNISVAVTNEFMKAAKANMNFKLINPRNNKIVKKVNAKKLFELIVSSAWKTGDPGLIFIDEINRKNPTPKLAKIEGTNPCGELPLLAYESCNLGSINLSKMLAENKIDWKKLERTVRIAVHFLDNVIDANKYPLPQIEQVTKANRKIGLGIMGFADTLIRLKIPYDSKEAIKLAEKIISFIEKTAISQSKEIAKKRGAFPNHNKSRWKFKLRNATLTTIAPTGTISIIAGCSSGIEPLFALSFVRNVMEGKRLLEVNHAFQLELVNQGLWSEHLIRKIAQTGSCLKTNLPKTIKKVFRTSLDIKPEWHVKMQAAFQKYVDNAVSKTVNLPENASKEEVRKVYLLAWKLRCKGITVYRYGSKEKQVLYKGAKGLIAKPQFSQSCPTGVCSL